MCGAAALPVLKFIAPMVLPQLANRIFGGKQADAKPANFQQTAAPGTKLAGQAATTGEDEAAKEDTQASETEKSKSAKLKGIRQNNPNKTTGASDAPAASGAGSNISGGAQNYGGVTVPNLGPAI
tara:strand:+ start:376 stop:750 length:375 start_codon:yes stop_codon:yes gene_type:complete